MNSSNASSSSKDPNTMDWMYKGPASLVNREDYLLGRTIDKSLKILDEAEKGHAFSYLDEVQKDLTPMSIFASGPFAGPVDVIRKIKEDPLFQIQKKEEESLKLLLKNPIKMKTLRDMAAKNEKSERSKSKKQQNRKRGGDSSSSSSSDNDDVDIDKILAQKLTSLKDMKSQLVKDVRKRKHESDDDDNDSSHDKRSHRSRHEHDRHHEGQSSSNQSHHRHHSPEHRRSSSNNSNSKRYYDNYSSISSSSSRGSYKDKSRDDRFSSRDDKYSKHSSSRSSTHDKYKSSSSSSSSRPEHHHKKSLDEEEKQRKMKEMLDNAKWREEQRSKNVNKFREEQKKEEEKLKTVRDPGFIRKQLVEAADTGSVEKRIKSNSYNIQRSKFAMDQNFARR